MKILSVDTSMQACSASILNVCGDTLQDYSCYDDHEVKHAENLFPMIHHVLEKSGTVYKDLSNIAVSVGPGSFTGVRIGIAAVRGLALSLNAKISSFTSLQAIARGVLESLDQNKRDEFQEIVVVMDARRHQVFFQKFAMDCRPTSTAYVLNPCECESLLDNKPALIVGSGADILQKIIRTDVPYHYDFFDILPNAKYLGLLAFEFQDIETDIVSPLYLREPDAKVSAKIL